MSTINPVVFHLIPARVPFAVFALPIAAAVSLAASVRADDYVVNVASGRTQTIDAAFVAALGSKNLVKTERGTLVSSSAMFGYTGTITIREVVFKITTTSDLGVDGTLGMNGWGNKRSLPAHGFSIFCPTFQFC